MTYLVDTNVISELAPMKPERQKALGDWLPAATIAGELIDAARAAGQTPGFADAAIAAIAKANGLIILTANRRHFAPFGSSSLNPFDALPPLPGAAPER